MEVLSPNCTINLFAPNTKSKGVIFRRSESCFLFREPDQTKKRLVFKSVDLLRGSASAESDSESDDADPLFSDDAFEVEKVPENNSFRKKCTRKGCTKYFYVTKRKTNGKYPQYCKSHSRKNNAKQ